MGGAGLGPWGPSLAAPDHWLQGGLQTDFHVQWVGAGKVDFDVEVTDDDRICQVEGVAVRGMSFIPLCREGGRKRHENLSRTQNQRSFLPPPTRELPSQFP